MRAASGQGLSPRTVNYVHSVLRKAFDDAENIDQVIVVNPATRAKRPPVEAVSQVHEVGDARQLARFLDEVKAVRAPPVLPVGGVHRCQTWRAAVPAVVERGPR